MNLKPAGYWFKHSGYTDPALDRRTATTTGQMLYQIVDPRPPRVVLSLNSPTTPPSPSTIAAHRRRETYTTRFSEHDNRNIIQNYGEYFGQGFGKRLMPHSARHKPDWTIPHNPVPVHPDRSVTKRDYRGWPALDNQPFSSASMTNSMRQRSSGHWMTSSYADNAGDTFKRLPIESMHGEDYQRMPIHSWQY